MSDVKNQVKSATTTAAAAADDGLSEITTNPLMWKPESCKDAVVEGYLRSFVMMPYAKDEDTKEQTKAWNAFEIELTKPSRGEDAEGNVKDEVPGKTVRVALTKNLECLIPQFRAATEAGKLLKISIQATNKVKLSGARTMWEFVVKTDQKLPPERKLSRDKTMPYLVDNRSSEDIGAMLGINPVTGQILQPQSLPALNGASTEASAQPS